MVAANKFHPVSIDDASLPFSNALGSQNMQHKMRDHNIEVILDIEHRDWDYNIQAGE
jgi:hypothetical protein